MAKPRKTFTPEELEQIERLASLLSQSQLADFFGISGRHFRRLMEKDDALRSAYKKGRANAIASVAGNLLRKAQGGDNTAMIFYLKTQAGWSEKTIIDLNAELPELIFKLQSDEDDA
jgi:DNA-binding CsgD family transcriptional regulator